MEKRYQENLIQQRKKEAKESQKADEMTKREIEANERFLEKEAKQREQEQERRERLRAKLLAKQEKISQMLLQLS